jgi:hypothetical protein
MDGLWTSTLCGGTRPNDPAFGSRNRGDSGRWRTKRSLNAEPDLKPADHGRFVDESRAVLARSAKN